MFRKSSEYVAVMRRADEEIITKILKKLEANEVVFFDGVTKEMPVECWRAASSILQYVITSQGVNRRKISGMTNLDDPKEWEAFSFEDLKASLKSEDIQLMFSKSFRAEDDIAFIMDRYKNSGQKHADYITLIMDLYEYKRTYAGFCARWTFNWPISHIKSAIDNAIESCSNWSQYILDGIGVASESAKNTLFCKILEKNSSGEEVRCLTPTSAHVRDVILGKFSVNYETAMRYALLNMVSSSFKGGIFENEFEKFLHTNASDALTFKHKVPGSNYMEVVNFCFKAVNVSRLAKDDLMDLEGAVQVYL